MNSDEMIRISEKYLEAMERDISYKIDYGTFYYNTSIPITITGIHIIDNSKKDKNDKKDKKACEWHMKNGGYKDYCYRCENLQ